MSLFKAAIFFITGASGVGKSTLVEQLKLLNLPSCVVCDFDERGVPANADEVWRKRETALWLDVAEKNLKANITTIICGVSVPAEVIAVRDVPRVFFGLIKVDDLIIEKRLKARGWSENLIKDNICWAAFLEKGVAQVEHSKILNASQLQPEKVSSIFADWILSVIAV